MNKKQLVIFFLCLVILAVSAILGLKYLILPSSQNPSVGQNPPSSAAPPVSATPGIMTWTGSLELQTGQATIKVADKTYPLTISEADASNVLINKGFKTGDIINVMGKLKGDKLEMAGVNKLIK